VSESAGWDAIEAHLRAKLGGAPAKHWGSVVKWSLGGPDPLDGVSAYANDDHWLFVGFGLSELYQKTSKLAHQSGWGIELTIRIPRHADDRDPPTWPIGRMNQLARYVFESRNVLLPGDYLDANGAVSATVPTSALRAILFALDPDLGELEGPNGKVRFVQIVGVTTDEYTAAQRWRTDGVLSLLAQISPKWITDLHRTSWLEMAPSLRDAAREGAEREGSWHGASFTKQLRVEKDGTGFVIEVGAITIPDLVLGLTYRVPFARPFELHGPERALLRLVSGERSTWDASKNELTLTAGDARAIASALPQRRGDHAAGVVHGVRFRVVPTEIRGSRNEVVRVLG
jgi:hypothetical protein